MEGVPLLPRAVDQAPATDKRLRGHLETGVRHEKVRQLREGAAAGADAWRAVHQPNERGVVVVGKGGSAFHPPRQ